MFFGNWSTNRNKITKLDGTSSLFLDGFAGSSSRAITGTTFRSTLGRYKFDRDATGALILDSNGFPTAAESEVVEI
jgi:hypothetical protein